MLIENRTTVTILNTPSHNSTHAFISCLQSSSLDIGIPLGHRNLMKVRGTFRLLFAIILRGSLIFPVYVHMSNLYHHWHMWLHQITAQEVSTLAQRILRVASTKHQIIKEAFHEILLCQLINQIAVLNRNGSLIGNCR